MPNGPTTRTNRRGGGLLRPAKPVQPAYEWRHAARQESTLEEQRPRCPSVDEIGGQSRSLATETLLRAARAGYATCDAYNEAP